MTTILDRVLAAFIEAYSQSLKADPDNALRLAIADVITHFGAELVVMDANHPNIPAHQAARLLLQELQEEVGR